MSPLGDNRHGRCELGEDAERSIGERSRTRTDRGRERQTRNCCCIDGCTSLRVPPAVMVWGGVFGREERGGGSRDGDP